jgi:hypothetical protein
MPFFQFFPVGDFCSFAIGEFFCDKRLKSLIEKNAFNNCFHDSLPQTRLCPLFLQHVIFWEEISFGYNLCEIFF